MKFAFFPTLHDTSLFLCINTGVDADAGELQIAVSAEGFFLIAKAIYLCHLISLPNIIFVLSLFRIQGTIARLPALRDMKKEKLIMKR